MKKYVLFLGYSRKETSLIDAIEKKGYNVIHKCKKINNTENFDFVISYGYKHIIKKSIIDSSEAKLINLHISFLPWNRGAHPNFWSFFDDTPKGVSIHFIDEGIDTGNIILQKKVKFKKNEDTFSSTYKRLKIEIESLFLENIENIFNGNYVSKPQSAKGSFHVKSDLPVNLSGWDAKIIDELKILKNTK